LHVVDTAGLRDALDEVEKIGVARAWVEIESADAVLFLHDLTRHACGDAEEMGSYNAEDASIASVIASKLSDQTPVIHVWNKSDLVSAAVQQAAPAGVLISAKSGEGLTTLRQQLLTTVGWQAAPDGLFMARERHVQALQKVSDQLHVAASQLAARQPALDLLAEDLRQAQLHLSEITGAFSSDDLLGEIFSRFCIGK
jgi:tRNA modification GTPase